MTIQPPSTPIEKEVPPDGGWGWLVLSGTLVVSILIPGTIKSLGVLFVEFMDVFEATPVATSWIPALCYFLYCSLGPLSSYLCMKTSYRTVTFIGGIFAASGMMLSYFADSIEFLYFSYGVLVGTGAGLSYPPGIFIVTSYFVKLRGIANGLAVSGSAIGSIILPPIIRHLLQIYGYRGTTLILGALCLNSLGAAMLYEPVEKHMKKIKVYPEEKEENQQEIQVAIIKTDDKLCDKINDPCKKEEETIVIPIQHDVSPKDDMTPSEGKQLIHDKQECHTSKEELDFKQRTGEESERRWSDAMVGGPWHGSTLLVTKPKNPSPTSILGVLGTPVFLVLLAANSTSFISYANFTILLPAYALELEYDKDTAANLLSIVAGLDLVGRVVGSALTDLLPIDKSVYFFGGLLVSGAALALLPAAGTTTQVCALCALFGLASGTYIGLSPTVLAQYMGDSRLVTSYSMVLFVGGLLQLAGPPICGLIYEYIHRYSQIISFLGLMLILGSGCGLIIPFLKRSKWGKLDYVY